jgi:creatinine amidohydrolase
MLDETERRYGIHGGHAETALMRALAPTQVAAAPGTFPSRERELATRWTAYSGGAARLAWRAEDLNPAGPVGDAAKATAADGERLLDFLAARTVEVMEELLALPLPADPLSR